MSQVPRAVSLQVRQETQKLAKKAKEFSGRKGFEIETALQDSKALLDEGGSLFSELFTGKKSKLHGIFEFHQELQKHGLIPPPLEPGTLDFAFAPADLTATKTDWATELKKIRAFKKARDKASVALLDLAKAMDAPLGRKMYFSLLQNFCLEQAAELSKVNEMKAKPKSAADQIKRLSDWVGDMTVFASSGWDYSADRKKSGAKVVQLNAKNDDKPNKIKTTKMTKNL